jgi:hypothetical protein
LQSVYCILGRAKQQEWWYRVVSWKCKQVRSFLLTYSNLYRKMTKKKSEQYSQSICFEYTWILSHPTKVINTTHLFNQPETCVDDLARSSESLFFFANIKHSQDWSGPRYRFRTGKLNPCNGSKKSKKIIDAMHLWFVLICFESFCSPAYSWP